MKELIEWLRTIEGPAKIEAGAATAEDLMDFIACSEFSEWNGVFLYVVNTLELVDPKANNAKFLAKPSPIGQIKSAVAEVLS